MRRISTACATAALVLSAVARAQQNQPNQPHSPDQNRGQQNQPTQRDPQPRNGQQNDAQHNPGREGKKSEPAPEVKRFEHDIGAWQLSGQRFDQPNASPETITGTCVSEWILGGRFMKTTVHATCNGQPLEGVSVSGYDDGKKKLVATWIDNQCNAIKMDEATSEPGAKTVNYIGESTGPDGKMIKCRRTAEATSDDQHRMTWYITESGQPERKVMEINFKRSNRSAMAENPERSETADPSGNP